MAFDYPKPRRDDSIVENHHGTEVADPYRWMEDPDADETKAFVDAQNAISQPYINGHEHKEKITKLLTELWDYPKSGVPSKKGNRYFFFKNSGLQNQSVFYVQDSLDSDPRVFFDPNTLSEDGTVSMTSSSFSEDGTLWAYGLSKSGSDWFDVHFRTVDTGKDFPETLSKVKFSNLTWTHDNKGVFYGWYPEIDESDASGRSTLMQSNQKLCYHRIGTPQSEDILVAEFPDHPKWRITTSISQCGKYLIVSTQEDCRDNLIFITDLSKLGEEGITGKLELTQVVYQLKHDYYYVTNTGSRFVFHTNAGAPNYRLVTFDLESDRPDDYRDRTSPWPMQPLVAEHESNVLEWVNCVHKDKLVLCYMKDVKHVLDVHDLNDGKLLYNVKLDVGSIVGYSGKESHTEIFFAFSSMITPSTIYRLDVSQENPTPEVYKETEIKGFDSSNYKVEQEFYQSKDGTRIPMFIASRKDAKRDGSMPCLLYGYGGFNISLTPYFSVSQLFFIQHYGYLAIPNIRGGGEYGENWHNGGRLMNKQNSYDDFQAAAEFLIKEKYTCTAKLAIKGGSNGGLLVGACVNQRPELFGAGVAAVGVMDMLRFHKFTIGNAWCSDFGNPDQKEHFENIIKFSPLHNIRKPEVTSQYPAMLLTTADHDDRVVPSHTLKYIAQLQYQLGTDPDQKQPLIARIETKAGHGGGKPTSKVIEEVVDVFCFLAKALDYKFID